MFAEIHWTLHIQARTEEGMHRVIRRFRDVVGSDVALEASERYHKEPTLLLWIACLTSPLDVPDAQTGVCRMLGIANHVGLRWTVTAPSEYENGRWSFAGWMDTRHSIKPRVVGIHEAGFEICNFPMQGREPEEPL